jgi:hypothetical protein
VIKATGINVSSRPSMPGGSLVEYGQGVQSQAAGMISQSAQLAQKRDEANRQIRQSNKSGIASVGSAVGGIAGGVFGGPMGAMVGSVAGGMLGSMLG